MEKTLKKEFSSIYVPKELSGTFPQAVDRFFVAGK